MKSSWNDAPLALKLSFVLCDAVIVVQTIIFGIALYHFW